MSQLFSKTTLGSLTLQNHLVMAPMTRNRATNNIPNELMAQYYAQRATAGLIITDGYLSLAQRAWLSSHSGDLFRSANCGVEKHH